MRAAVLASVVVATACGDNLLPSFSDDELLNRLNALPGVTATQEPTGSEGFAYVVLAVTQPVDHDHPDGPTFQQRVSLLHRDSGAPMVAVTSGYWDYYRDLPIELTHLLGANQISIEHRYFGESRPEPADWELCTIEQMAADQHAIISALRTMYGGAFVTTGASKGGMTAVYHRRFYPDDVEGTVPLVAPISFGAPDLRYEPFLDTLGPPDCRADVRAVAVELLANRRGMVEARTLEEAAIRGSTYTRIPIPQAAESAIVWLEWAFWQYLGVDTCDDVPDPSASDAKLWAFLRMASPPSDNSDSNVADFEAYYYQAEHQLGFPSAATPYLDAYTVFDDNHYRGLLPIAASPVYDGGAAMRDIDDWVQRDGAQLAFVYGEWDPWTGGAFSLGDAEDSLFVVQARANHGAQIGRLAQPDLDAVLAKLTRWTGVVPQIDTARARARLGDRDESVEPRIPPALRRALHAH